MPDDRLDLWFLPPAFFSQAGHGLRPAPGIPCALFILRVHLQQSLGRIARRETESSCLLAGQDNANAQAPSLANLIRWHRKLGVVRHVFTHVPLELKIDIAKVPSRTRAPGGMRWGPIVALDGKALPNVMRKVVAHGLF